MRKTLLQIVLFCIFFLFLFTNTRAQSKIWIGVQGGISIPSISGGNNELSEGFTSRLAPNFGIFAEYSVDDHFSIQPELNFAGQGGKRNGLQPITASSPQLQAIAAQYNEPYLYADFKNVAVLNYLELPILAKYSWGKRTKFYVNAGPYLGYLLSAKEKTSGTSPIYHDKTGDQAEYYGQELPPQSFDSTVNVYSSIHKFNVGITGGVGLSYPVCNNGRIIFDARFEYGFVNIQSDPANGKNNTGNVLLSLGYAYRLAKKGK